MIQNLAMLDTSSNATIPSMYGSLEMEELATRYSMGVDELQVEWDRMIDLLEDLQPADRTLQKVDSMLHGKESQHLGLGSQLIPSLYMALCYSLGLAIKYSGSGENFFTGCPD